MDLDLLGDHWHLAGECLHFVLLVAYQRPVNDLVVQSARRGDLGLHGVGEGLGVLEGEESFFSAINRDALIKVNLEYVFPQRVLLDLRIVVAF